MWVDRLRGCLGLEAGFLMLGLALWWTLLGAAWSWLGVSMQGLASVAMESREFSPEQRLGECLWWEDFRAMQLFSSEALRLLWPWWLGVVGEVLMRVRRGVRASKLALEESLLNGSSSGAVRIAAPQKRALGVGTLAVLFSWGSGLGSWEWPLVLFFWMSSVAGVWAGYRFLPSWISRHFFSGEHRQRILLLGEPGACERLGGVLSQVGVLGVEVLQCSGGEACFGDGSDGERERFWGDLERRLSGDGMDGVIAAGMSLEWLGESGLAELCESLGLRLSVAEELSGATACGPRMPLGGESVWRLEAVYREPLQSPLNRMLKRGLDLMVALPATIGVLLPMMLLTWVMQRRQSKGPLFCRQWRHGRGNRPFLIWKFRTMFPGDFSVADQAVVGDPRVYPFGRFLRRHSLDELPQVLNVLRGEMSLVGPRPHLVEHTDRFSTQRGYLIRAFVKPGLTGLAQVQGCRGEIRCPEDLERRVKWDRVYVEGWSLGRDFGILWRTVGEVFCPSESAY